jgi:hypothetical protein
MCVNPFNVDKPEIPAAPTPDTDRQRSLIKEAERRRRALLAGKGMQSVIHTSAQGVQGAAPVQRKTLLGQ